ncbi:MAG TPA: F0F1 ATP synthase subunit A [Chitinophagaceae bacterium]|nr:F0F1 ATP synthase subunit A [Chitinophagaceae bacterium]
MRLKSFKSLLVAAFSVFFITFSLDCFAQEKTETPGAQAQTDQQKEEKKEGFNASEVIFGHVLDAHEFHFLSYKDGNGQEHSISIPLPVILYSPQKGWSFFMASAFEEGKAEVDGYKLEGNKIVPVDESVKMYDLSLTRNVVQMILALVLLVWIMVSAAKKYQKDPKKAPSGMQNAMEVIIMFVRDEVARPNVGKKTDKYMPYFLTIFFFILINNVIGLVPGTANVTGNIAFTLVFSLISFIVILISTNGHYWGHIVNPPVPGFVKPIMILVEVLGIFTKPFALMIRLFANMLAGHIIIICLISLIFIFGALNAGVGWGFSPVSIAFSVFIYFIEILVAFIQAFIFTNLTAVFIGQAMEGAHDDHGEHHEDPVMV